MAALPANVSTNGFPGVCRPAERPGTLSARMLMGVHSRVVPFFLASCRDARIKEPHSDSTVVGS